MTATQEIRNKLNTLTNNLTEDYRLLHNIDQLCKQYIIRRRTKISSNKSEPVK